MLVPIESPHATSCRYLALFSSVQLPLSNNGQIIAFDRGSLVQSRSVTSANISPEIIANSYIRWISVTDGVSLSSTT